MEPLTPAHSPAADLIIGGFVPGVPGFAGEQDVSRLLQNNSASVNPVLVANTGTTTSSFSFNMDPTLINDGLIMLTQQPFQASSGGTNPTNVRGSMNRAGSSPLHDSRPRHDGVVYDARRCPICQR